MLEGYSMRTDLALEEKERFDSDNVEVQGVVLEESYDEKLEICITKVIIETENGAKAMGKPAGTYLTLEIPNLAVPDEEYHREVSAVLAEKLGEMISNLKLKTTEDLKVLVAGLGNRQVTPDALGPFVADHLCVNRHIVKEYGKYAMGLDKTSVISALIPGVMGQTGMETSEIIRGVVKETKPELLIVVDALAARNSRRLNRTIQIADTGIHPGSGVGNHRNAITKESIGIPVIAIGIPTVVDAATIVNDTMENLLQLMESSSVLDEVREQLCLHAKGLIAPHLNGMFVTPKDIDEVIRQISCTVSESINIFCETYSVK